MKFAVRTLTLDADAGTIKELVESIANKAQENYKAEEEKNQLKAEGEKAKAKL